MSARDELNAIIQRAIDADLITRVPTGQSGIQRKQKPETATKFHAEHCGKGGRLSRHRRLDEIDGDWS